MRFVKSYPLVGHSVGFDIKMLKAQGMNFPQPAYDTFDLATLLIPHAPAYRLGTLAAMLGITHDEAHRALSDSDVTAPGVSASADAHRGARSGRAFRYQPHDRARSNWPQRDMFGEVERAKARMVFVENPEPAKCAGHSELKIQGSKLNIIPLKPTGNAEPVDIDAVRRFFTPDGPMGRAFEGYEQRPQQVQMAEAVAAALNNGDNLMVEAGTGTGKGLSYLVPAAMYAAQRGERVVISTNTINLQDQLFFKDIPALQRIMAQQPSPAYADSKLKTKPQPQQPSPQLKTQNSKLKTRSCRSRRRC